MATIRRKVYKKIPGGRILTNLTRGMQTIDLTTGPETPETLRIVQYGSDVDSQGLLNIVADLIENDKFVNAEVNAVNELINEGVFDLDGCRFDITIITSPNNAVRIGPGKGKFISKVGNNDIDANIYIVEDEYEFTVPNIITPNYYRRDLIQIVFRDINKPDDVPYLEYVPGQESQYIPTRYYVFDKLMTEQRSAYPLYSILYKNDGTNTIYQEYDVVYQFAGWNKITRVVKTPAYMRPNAPGQFYGGFYASPTKYRTFTDKFGNIIDPLYGSTALAEDKRNTFYDIETICNFDPTNKLSFHLPDVGFIAPLEEGDPLTFPFLLPEIVDRYSSTRDIELRSFTIALNKDVVPEEGLEIHLYTAKYFVNENNRGFLNIQTTTLQGQYTIITVDVPINTLTKLTANAYLYETATQGVSVGDFIFVKEGQGQFQISKIVDILNTTTLKIITPPVLLHSINDTNPSQIYIFKTSTIQPVGTTLNQLMLAQKPIEEQIDYETQYPYSTNTGISILPFDNTENKPAIAYGTTRFETQGYNFALNNRDFIISGNIGGNSFGPITITLTANCTQSTPSYIQQIVNEINTKFTNAGINDKVEAYIAYYYYVGIRSKVSGISQTFTLANGTNNALTILGLTAGTYTGENKYKPNIKKYYDATPSSDTRLFYHMPNPPGTFEGHIKVTFPFKIRLNFNQWYFARISMLDRNIPYNLYGIRPQIVTLNYNWARTYGQTYNMSFNGFFTTITRSNPGKYPLLDNGEYVFKIEDEFGDITVDSIDREIAGYPKSYRLKAKYLAGMAFEYPHYYNVLDPNDNEENVAYVDILNGIISFYMNENPGQMHYNYPQKIYLTYYYTNILSAELDTELMIHKSKADNNAILNLWSIIEYLLNPKTGQPRYGRPYEFEFTATANQHEFIIPIRGDDIGSTNNTLLFKNGLLIPKSKYSLDNHSDGVHGLVIIDNSITINNGDNIVVKIGLLDYPSDLRYSVPWEENFVAIAGQREFILKRTPDGRNFIALYVSGVLQPKTHYDLRGNKIILSEPCLGGEIITVKSWLPSQNVVSSGSINVNDIDLSFLHLTDTPQDYYGHAGKLLGVNSTETGITFLPLGGFVNTQDIYTAVVGQTNFVLSGAPKDPPDGILCWIDGAFQSKNSFTYDAITNSVTLDTPCNGGEKITFMYMKIS